MTNDKAPQGPFGAPTWRCDICHEDRPDASIDVLKSDIGQVKGLAAGIAVRNIKYCNDTPDCFAGAVRIRQADQGETPIGADGWPALRPVPGEHAGSPRVAYLEILIGGRGRINVSNLEEVRTTVHSVY